MNDTQPPSRRLDPKWTAIAVIILLIIIFSLFASKKAAPPSNPMETGSAKKMRQSLKDARGW